MSTTDFETYDANELGQYRSLSTLAIGAFVLGLCSALTFVSPLLVVVPLAAIGAALLALKAIAASAGGLTGTRFAQVGLALAILFGVGSYARGYVRDYLLQRQAEKATQQWIALAAEGRSEEMLQIMTKAATDKLSPSVEEGQPMPFFGNILAAALLRHDPLVERLAELKGDENKKLELLDVGVSAASRPAQVGLNYVITNDDNTQQTCAFLLKRYAAAGDDQVWLIDSWNLK